MSGVTKKIDKELLKRAKESLKGLGNKGYMGIKLQAIISSKEHGISKVSEILGIARSTLYKWIRKFKIDLKELKLKAGRGRSSILKEEQKERIKDWLKGDSSLTIKEVKKKIEEEMKVKVSNTTVYNIIKSCGFSYQTPRPRHYKADKVAQEEFKKKL
jgi:transposase